MLQKVTGFSEEDLEVHDHILEKLCGSLEMLSVSEVLHCIIRESFMCFCNFWRGATDQKVPGVPWAPVGKEIALEVITDVFEGKHSCG